MVSGAVSRPSRDRGEDTRPVARGSRWTSEASICATGPGRSVDMTRSHASLERTPPVRVEGPPDATYDDPDALRVVMALPDDGPGLDGDREIGVESVNALGGRIDVLPRLALAPSSCARAYPGVRCWASAAAAPRRRRRRSQSPLVAERSIKAEVGGAIVLRDGGHKAQMVRVLGPRASPVGPIGRLRATLRPFVVRISPGGAPAIGGTDVGAVDRASERAGVRVGHLGPVRPHLRRLAHARREAGRSAAVASRCPRRRSRGEPPAAGSFTCAPRARPSRSPRRPASPPIASLPTSRAQWSTRASSRSYRPTRASGQASRRASTCPFAARTAPSSRSRPHRAALCPRTRR